MVEAILSDEQFDAFMDDYFLEKSFGKMKYFWEIVVPEKRMNEFLEWLKVCEYAHFKFLFADILRYKDYHLMYGFSNFEIPETLEVKAFDFSFVEKDALYNQFFQWREESVSFLMPVSYKITIDVLLESKKEKRKSPEPVDFGYFKPKPPFILDGI